MVAPGASAGSEADGNACAVCGKDSNLKKCSLCHEVWYCSAEHQTLDWRNGHRKKCSRRNTPEKGGPLPPSPAKPKAKPKPKPAASPAPAPAPAPSRAKPKPNPKPKTAAPTSVVPYWKTPGAASGGSGANMLFAGGGKPRRRMRKVESGIPFAEPAPIGYVYEPWKDCHYSGDNNPPSYRPEVPKLTKPGWRSVPPIEKLHKMTDAQLSCVAKFAVIRDGYGECEWVNPTDVRYLNLDLIARIGKDRVEMYPRKVPIEEPPVGYGLNKEATITHTDGKAMLARLAKQQGVAEGEEVVVSMTHTDERRGVAGARNYLVNPLTGETRELEMYMPVDDGQGDGGVPDGAGPVSCLSDALQLGANDLDGMDIKTGCQKAMLVGKHPATKVVPQIAAADADAPWETPHVELAADDDGGAAALLALLEDL